MSTDSAVRLASGCLWRELPNGDVELTIPEPSPNHPAHVWDRITWAHDYYAGIEDRTKGTQCDQITT